MVEHSHQSSLLKFVAGSILFQDAKLPKFINTPAFSLSSSSGNPLSHFTLHTLRLLPQIRPCHFPHIVFRLRLLHLPSCASVSSGPLTLRLLPDRNPFRIFPHIVRATSSSPWPSPRRAGSLPPPKLSQALSLQYPLCSSFSPSKCKGKEMHKPLDLALLFVGKELQSSDLSLNRHADPSLLELLKISFTRSNFSMAFPYVSASEEEKLENSLVSGFSKACGDDLEIGDVAFLGSCSVEGANLKENAAVHSIQDFLTKRMEESHKGATDLVVFCNGDSLPSENVDNTQSEGKILSELLGSMEMSGAKYSVLYVSDPSRSIQYPSYREVQRFLAESASGNLSGNSTFCDEVCQIKSSLLEGLLVGIVLLIILISGLCCMMGIDTPTRFETPQE